MGISVLRQFWSQYQLPQPYEGHDREVKLQTFDQREQYADNDVKIILERLQSSPLSSASARSPAFSSPRGQSYRGHARGKQFSQNATRRGRGGPDMRRGEHYSPTYRGEGSNARDSARSWRNL